MAQSSNRRIAVNTIYMYARLFISLIIGLYTSRVVLLVLGVSDYGLFSIVGAVLTLFTFITGSLGAATSRFLNAEMGRPDGDVNKVFNLNQMLHIVFAGILLILAETIGLWYVCNKLVVTPDKLDDALFVYQITIATTCLGIINSPCSSIFCAKEKFGFQAALDITNNVIRLGCVILLQCYNGNSLRMYTLIMCFTTVNSFAIYYWFAQKWWPEIMKFRFIKGWENYKPILSFGSWNLLTTASMMTRSTGSDLIINFFFGTAVNGAFAISKTISAQVLSFSSNFDGASAPQIIQSYNAGDMERCNYLVNKMGRFNLLLFELCLFPLWIELDYILHLWLKEVPEGVLLLCKLNLILAAVALSCGGLTPLINGSGKIKWFTLALSSLYLLCIPVGYVLFSIGFPAYSMLLLFIFADFLFRIVQLVLARRILKFDSWDYAISAYAKPVIIAVIMSLLIYVYSFLSIDDAPIRLTAIAGCAVITLLLICFVGLSQGERKKIFGIITRKFRRKQGNEKSKALYNNSCL